MTREEATNCLADLLDAYNADWHGDYFYDNSDAVCDAVVFLMENRPRWISVEERLPEDKCECLVYVKTHNKFSGYMTISWFYPCYDCSAPDLKGRKVWTGYDSEWGVFELRNVTHWMPLPEPPEVEV